jgi:hypothetical protein
MKQYVIYHCEIALGKNKNSKLDGLCITNEVTFVLLL